MAYDWLTPKRGRKLLEKMRANPRGDWRIWDVEAVCRAFDLHLDRPSGGSHWGLKHETQNEILTIPSARPIKQIYIKKVVKFIEAVESARRVRGERDED